MMGRIIVVIVISVLFSIGVLTAMKVISLWDRDGRIATEIEMKASIDAKNEIINRLELKLEFLERHCRWLIFLKEALPSDITAELEALVEQLKQRREKAARIKYGYSESPVG